MQPSGLTSRFVAQQNPPDIEDRSLPSRSIVNSCHSVVRTTGPIPATSESAYSPVIPPILNSSILSPPISPRAQNVTFLAAVRSYPPGRVPQLFGGFCQ